MELNSQNPLVVCLSVFASVRLASVTWKLLGVHDDVNTATEESQRLCKCFRQMEASVHRLLHTYSETSGNNLDLCVDLCGSLHLRHLRHGQPSQRVVSAIETRERVAEKSLKS
jgi:hypothetical protein